ncbi:MAG: 4-oxalocrotonate tautomerase family protein [Oscillospiraceae bacterium]|nr:4-oxalocrotonate tautomerase family protein [Oscillospiraceae bacterium]
MPHISIKMLKGRTDEQKKMAADKVAEALYEAIGCSKDHISVTVEDYTPEEWQDVFAADVTAKQDKLFRKANYDPRDLLKK